jgi:hypothetical protein
MKITLTRPILLLTAAALSTSCWQTDQNLSLCPPDETLDNNLELRFRVQNVPDSEFEEYIDRVEVFLFDADKNYLETALLSGSGEGRGGGGLTANFTLAPGTYHVVCWGNLNGNSRKCGMDETSNFENSFVEIASAETGDPVYYTPYKTSLVRAATRSLDAPETRYDIYTVNIPPGTRTVKELVFVKVHRKVELFMDGHAPVSKANGCGPHVEHCGATGRFDFLLRRQCEGITLKRASQQRLVEGREMFTTDIISQLVPLTGSEEVHIYHPETGALAATVNLEQFVEENKIADTSYIPVHIVFGVDASVSVSVPAWLANEITWTKK